jgi:hypothetical protein
MRRPSIQLGAVAALLMLIASGEARAQGVDPGDYFPLTPGTTWTYDETGDQTTLQIQNAPVLVGGVPTAERLIIAGEDVGEADYFTSTDGVLLHREVIFDDFLGALILDFTPPVTFAPNPTQLGDSSFETGTFTATPVGGGGSLPGTYSLDREVTAIGPVDTPFGFFCDVAVLSTTFTLTPDGEDPEVTTADGFLVRGVGQVAEQGFENGEPFLDLLVSTSLPLPPPDADCDGTPDTTDLCPFFAESAPGADADGNGIGNECECGDQNGDGKVDVSDLLAINAAIFDPAQVTDLCDANDDGLCDVNDILRANAKIFGSPAYCSRFPDPGP